MTSLKQNVSVLSLLGALFALSVGCADLTPCRIGEEGCICRSTTNPRADQGCDDGLVCAAGECMRNEAFAAPRICHNACTFNYDGKCDDGVVGSSATAYCGYGSDCFDCGWRENECPQNEPVFCPQRIDGVDQCWPSGTDCLTVRACDGASGAFSCGSSQAVDCDATPIGTCVSVSASACPPTSPTVCLGEGACLPKFSDCNTIAACGAITTACYTNETLLCSSGAASCQVNP